MAGFAYLLLEFFCPGNMQILNPAAHFDRDSNNPSYMLLKKKKNTLKNFSIRAELS